PTSPHLPYTTLFRSLVEPHGRLLGVAVQADQPQLPHRPGLDRRQQPPPHPLPLPLRVHRHLDQLPPPHAAPLDRPPPIHHRRRGDRKSTRLNSSHAK